jgi:septal ring factor EnvC (AmiA/AmiB activator)
MQIAAVVKSRLFWICTGIVILLVLFLALDGVNAGLGMAKRLLASKEIEIANQLKEKLAVTEKKVKDNEAKAKGLETKAMNLEVRLATKEKEILSVKSELKEVKGRLEDAEQRISSISIPVALDDRVKRLRELGLKSAIVAPRPK